MPTSTLTQTPPASPPPPTPLKTYGANGGFTGEWTDATGLVHLRARYYQPGVGRFFQVDPWQGYVNLPATLNPYTYALANPIYHSDPCGKNIFDDCVKLFLTLSLASAVIEPSFIVEATGVITCGIIFLAAGGWVALHTALHADEASQDLVDLLEDLSCKTDLIDQLWPGAEIAPEPVPKPTPEPVGPDIFPIPRIDETPRPPTMVFRELGGRLSSDRTYYRRPYTSSSEFRRDPDGVSTFEMEYLPGIKPYIIGFTTLGRERTVPGASLPIAGIPCTATFTPQWGPGHWSINCIPIDETSQILSTYAKGAGGRSIDLNPRWTGSQDRRLP